MKKSVTIIFIASLAISSCEKEKEKEMLIDFCGVTGITGPVRYYLTPYDKSLFNYYSTFQTLSFIDSATNATTDISYGSYSSQVWNTTSGQSQVQDDTVNYGESAGIAYNYGTLNISDIHYYFSAHPNHVDSLGILIGGGNSSNQYPRSTSFWILNLVDTTTSNSNGLTPYVVLDSVTFLSNTFYDVYLLQNGNSLNPADSSNNCYYTKANGIIAFSDKRCNKFWIRTNF
jgi:hypothetical protein